MANTTMAKEFAVLVEEVRTGKPTENRTMEREKTRMRGPSISPQSKLV